MLDNIPSYISLVFALTTLATLIFIYYAIRNSGRFNYKADVILLGLMLWLILQGALTIINFYNIDTISFPPRFLLLILPPMLTILLLFVTKKGRKFMDGLPLSTLTYIHIVRIPVELVLYWLCLQKAVPELMTFAGRNFDILSGLTAPLVVWYGFQKQKLHPAIILLWNLIALGLLLNIVINAILSAPFAFQQFAYDQPNIAVLYFPFSFLPGFIVPAVLFAHLVSIRQLMKA